MSARLAARLSNFLLLFVPPPLAAGGRRRPDGESGQATAEYALVLLAVAALAMLVIAWATKTSLVGELLDLVFDQLKKRAKS